jgi:hypothetical protein
MWPNYNTIIIFVDKSQVFQAWVTNVYYETYLNFDNFTLEAVNHGDNVYSIRRRVGVFMAGIVTDSHSVFVHALKPTLQTCKHKSTSLVWHKFVEGGSHPSTNVQLEEKVYSKCDSVSNM